MYTLYSIVLTVGFILLLPKFLFDALFNGKYAAGFWQRFGSLPDFNPTGKRVVWLHCVSVGEVNATRTLVQQIKRTHPNLSLVVSTTTKTGQNQARETLGTLADLVFYFPFDWRWTVRRALRHIRPKVVLIIETEIWFNFFREAYKSGARVCIVNGRLSEKSFKRYRKIKKIMKRVLGYLELALMQDNADATRLMSLGIRGSKVKVTGNVKFDQEPSASEDAITAELRDRFGISTEAPLVIAASTHDPEEKWVLEAFKDVWKNAGERLPRLLIAPRHPERFSQVADVIDRSGFSYARRSELPSIDDKTAEVILLDTIGELRAAYPLAEVVFVGGSLVPHGGQSIYEPAAAGTAVVVGPHTHNFAAATKEFTAHGALRQLDQVPEKDLVKELAGELHELLQNADKRKKMGRSATNVMQSNRGAVDRTMDYLEPLLTVGSDR
jgi:3-deoxy-D-manno-octulosonic-acid transferase